MGAKIGGRFTSHDKHGLGADRNTASYVAISFHKNTVSTSLVSFVFGLLETESSRAYSMPGWSGKHKATERPTYSFPHAIINPWSSDQGSLTHSQTHREVQTIVYKSLARDYKSGHASLEKTIGVEDKTMHSAVLQGLRGRTCSFISHKSHTIRPSMATGKKNQYTGLLHSNLPTALAHIFSSGLSSLTLPHNNYGIK